MTGSVTAPKWDTWTRDEILAIRGYPSCQASSPALATPEACPPVTTDANLEASNGVLPPNSKPSVLTIAVATDTSQLPNGPVPLGTPEALPEPVEETVGLATGDRSCSECGLPPPAQSWPERVVCSQGCRQVRHDRLRKSRRPRVEVPALAAVPDRVETEVLGSLPVPLGGNDAGVLEAVVRLSTLLPAGWRAEVGPGSVTLSWRAS